MHRAQSDFRDCAVAAWLEPRDDRARRQLAREVQGPEARLGYRRDAGRDHHPVQAVRRLHGKEARREGRGVHGNRLCRHRAGAVRRPYPSRPHGRGRLRRRLYRQQGRDRAAGDERRAERRQGLLLGADRAGGQPLQDAGGPQGQDHGLGRSELDLGLPGAERGACAMPASIRRSISAARCSPAGTSRACSVCSRAISTVRSPGRRRVISRVSSAS